MEKQWGPTDIPVHISWDDVPFEHISEVANHSGSIYGQSSESNDAVLEDYYEM
ncbi:hypothetical protein FACS1894139_02810 [Planctomycetales bacterium]|nr:hypothetical protein FACS1894108_16070 [Planctomycetales bacterium]GHT03164.1 hypothetical protein FACS1894139_02810 [Planctomycetales bacterium]